MDALIEGLDFLDKSSIAYVLMIILFMAMAYLHFSALDEITRLRRALKTAVLENKNGKR
jgi:hypothetical protein